MSDTNGTKRKNQQYRKLEIRNFRNLGISDGRKDNPT